MTIKEIEEKSGMDRANIRYYEREGLLTPSRLENGYRDYSQEDLELLLRIKLLRSLHFSLEEIRGLKEGTRELSKLLDIQAEALLLEQQTAAYARSVCRAMQADHVTFENLDAEKYLNEIAHQEQETGGAYFPLQADRIPRVKHPIRRYLARMLDMAIYGLLPSAVLCFVFHVNMHNRSILGTYLEGFAGLALMLVLEPALLHAAGTTPGKAILGLRLRSSDGRKLTHEEALRRTWRLIGSGMGYGIPVYDICRQWKSYRSCQDGEALPWEEESISYELEDEKIWRWGVWGTARLACVGILSVMIAAQMFPPNRGPLTVEEFAENYNYYADYYGMNRIGYTFEPDGQWKENSYKDSGTYVYSLVPEKAVPIYSYELKDGAVVSLSYFLETGADQPVVGSFGDQMFLAAMAFVGAQEDFGLFSESPGRIQEQVEERPFGSFVITELGVEISCESRTNGLAAGSFLIYDEGKKDPYFRQKFSLKKKE